MLILIPFGAVLGIIREANIDPNELVLTFRVLYFHVTFRENEMRS